MPRLACGACGYVSEGGHTHFSDCARVARPKVEPKPNTLPIPADDFARGARFASLHVGATRPTIAPLLDAAARQRAEGEELGRAQAAEVLERVLAKIAEKGSPADLDVLRKVREDVAAELGRRLGTQEGV